MERVVCSRCQGSGHEPERVCLGSVTIPLRTVSESNHAGTVQEKARRRKEQRHVTGMLLRAHLGTPPALPIIVLVTRIAPLELDAHDNLRTSQKYIIDSVADWLGLRSDRDPGVTWTYAQRKGAAREVGVEISLFREAGAVPSLAPAPAPRTSILRSLTPGRFPR